MILFCGGGQWSSHCSNISEFQPTRHVEKPGMPVLQMLDGVGSCVQTDATTPSIVRTRSLLWEGYDP